jgi:3-deoxy-D-manno-octulosonic-acid transferase
LGKLLYLLFINTYRAAIHFASMWNSKAKFWVLGRKQFPASEPAGEKTVWMHCASLGEFEQARPVLESVKKQFPGVRVVLTFFSPSGYEVIKHNKLADRVLYLPMDGKRNAGKMIDAINPQLVIWFKYEFWYYYLTEFKRRDIPVILVAGLFRESQPFFKWYGSLWKKMLQSFTHIFVQNEDSKELLSTIGIDTNVSVGGDTRFDRVIEIANNMQPLPLIEKFCGNSKVIVAGSTWEDDEQEWIHYTRKNPQVKFIIAPHEIDDDNLKDVKTEFPGSMFYSDWEKLDGNKKDQPINVLIIDNVGMLSRLYFYGDITFVGGGFGEDGIHNILEAAVFGKPVIFGPEYEKFAEAVDMVEYGAAVSINNALELEKLLSQLWNDESLLREKGAAAKKYVYSNAGATKKIMDYIQEKRLLIN